MNDELILQLEDDEDFNIDITDPVPQITYKDYRKLDNKPQINGVELIGNKTLDELGGYTSEQVNNLISNERTRWGEALNAAVNAEECLTFWHLKDIV